MGVRCAFGIAVLVAVVFGGGQRSASPHEGVPVATIRIHDYAQIPTESMARAQQLVTHIYGAIGVRTRWLETRRPGTASHVKPAPSPPPRLLMIVLSPSMSRRQMVSEDTVGTAVVTRCDGGLAYVSFDRVRRVADASARNAMDMMGLVMAHEIGHLLTAIWDIPHAQTLAIVLGGVYRSQFDHKLTKLAQYGRRVWGLNGSDVEAAKESIDRTESFFEGLGIKTRLSSLGLDAADVVREVRHYLETADFKNLGEHKNIDAGTVCEILAQRG